MTTAVDAVAIARRLRGWRAPLAAWYGDPLEGDAARRLLAETDGLLRARLCTRRPVFQLQVLRLLCDYWLGAHGGTEYGQLVAAAGGRRERALLELVYGQLLMSRKRQPALQHLAGGFMLAADYLEPADYFLLVRRHELLGHIPLAATPAQPQELHSLLAEAAVIRQLQGGGRHACSVSHLDTLG